MSSRQTSNSGVPLYPKSLKLRLSALFQHDGRTFAVTSDQNGDLAEHVVDVKSSNWVMAENTKRWQIEMSRFADGKMLAEKTVVTVSKTGLPKGISCITNLTNIIVYSTLVYLDLTQNLQWTMIKLCF